MSNKRIISDITWKSKKIREVQPPDFRPEYTWIRPIVSDNGVFEYDPTALWAEAYVSARPGWTPEQVRAVLDEFIRVGLLLQYESGGRTWCYWVGDEGNGHLPPPSKRNSTFPLPPGYREATAELPGGYREGSNRVATSYPMPTKSFVGEGEGKGEGIGVGVGVGVGFGEGIGIGSGDGSNLSVNTPETETSSIDSDKTSSSSDSNSTDSMNTITNLFLYKFLGYDKENVPVESKPYIRVRDKFRSLLLKHDFTRIRAALKTVKEDRDTWWFTRIKEGVPTPIDFFIKNFDKMVEHHESKLPTLSKTQMNGAAPELKGRDMSNPFAQFREKKGDDHGRAN